VIVYDYFTGTAENRQMSQAPPSLGPKSMAFHKVMINIYAFTV